MQTPTAPQPAPLARPTSGLAIAALVFSIAAWVVLPLVGAIVGVVCGHMARGEIRRSRGGLDGDGLAVAALVVGYLHIGLCVLAAVVLLLILAGIFGAAWLN